MGARRLCELAAAGRFLNNLNCTIGVLGTALIAGQGRQRAKPCQGARAAACKLGLDRCFASRKPAKNYQGKKARQRALQLAAHRVQRTTGAKYRAVSLPSIYIELPARGQRIRTPAKLPLKDAPASVPPGFRSTAPPLRRYTQAETAAAVSARPPCGSRSSPLRHPAPACGSRGINPAR
jgi:hypothetical protein